MPERYLDKRLAERLTAFFGGRVSHTSTHEVTIRLRQWQWVKLVQTLDNAASNTPHYREALADFSWKNAHTPPPADSALSTTKRPL